MALCSVYAPRSCNEQTIAAGIGKRGGTSRGKAGSKAMTDRPNEPISPGRSHLCAAHCDMQDLHVWMERKAKVMSEKSKKSKENANKKAMRLAETTDVSLKQAKDLMRTYGKDSPRVEKAAKNFKAEG
jgi:hypothetical protein